MSPSKLINEKWQTLNVTKQKIEEEDLVKEMDGNYFLFYEYKQEGALSKRNLNFKKNKKTK